MKILCYILLLTMYAGLYSQPKPFDPDYYNDTLSTKKSAEFKELQKYREEFKKTGLPLTGPGPAYKYPFFYPDWCYHRGISLDKIEDYKKLGFFNDNYSDKVYADLYSGVMRSIVVIGKLLSFERNEEKNTDVAKYEITKIIKGQEYYKNFPKIIKCYSRSGGTFMETLKDGIDIKYSKKLIYFNKIEPLVGDEFILFIEKFNEYNVYGGIFKPEPEFYLDNVFYDVLGEYYDRFSVTEWKIKHIEEIFSKAKMLEELKAKK